MKRSVAVQAVESGASRIGPLSLVGLSLLAAIVRFPNLGKASFWWDECLTANLVRDMHDASPLVVLSAVSRGLSTYFVLLAPWAGGNAAEWALRLPSTLAGIALVPALALVGREIGGRSLGLKLGFLAAISPWMVWHSREARWYALTVLLVAIGLLYFVRLLRAWSWGAAAGCFVAGLAAASTYSPAVTVLILQAGWLGLTAPVRAGLTQRWRAAGRVRRVLLASTAVMFLLMAAGWIARTLVLPAIAGGARGFDFRNLGGPRPGAIAYTGIAHATGYTLGPGPSEWHLIDRIGVSPTDALLLVAGVVSFSLLMVIGARRIAAMRGRMFSVSLLTLAILPVCLVVAASWWTDHAYAPRHVIFVVPVSLTLAAAGLQRISLRRTALVAGATLIGLQAVSLWNLHYEPRYQREDVRAAARHIAARAVPGDLILLFGGVRVPWERYYDGPAPWKVVHAAGSSAWSADRLSDQLSSQTMVWVVKARMWEEPGAAELASVVDSWAPVLETSRFAGNVLVSRHRRDAAGRGDEVVPPPE